MREENPPQENEGLMGIFFVVVKLYCFVSYLVIYYSLSKLFLYSHILEMDEKNNRAMML